MVMKNNNAHLPTLAENSGSALTRRPCATCGVETLHRGVRCIHCDKLTTRSTIKAEKKLPGAGRGAMSKKRPNERKTFERDLDELTSLQGQFCAPIKDDAGKIIGWDVKGDELRAELQRLAIKKGAFSKKELALRQERYEKLGQPKLNSPEWLAELERIRKRFPKKPRRNPSSSSVNTDPNDFGSLYWQVLMLAARKAGGGVVEPIVLPSKSSGAWRGLHGKSPPQVLTETEAKRLSRWLWPLSRHHCPMCGPGSLHRGDQCVHCGRRLGAAYAATVGPKKRDWTLNTKKGGRQRNGPGREHRGH